MPPEPGAAVILDFRPGSEERTTGRRPPDAQRATRSGMAPRPPWPHRATANPRQRWNRPSCEGSSFTEDAVMQRLPTITEDIATWVAGSPALTARDRELFGHLTDGRSQRQISLAMGISINTVRGRIRRLLRKLDAATADDGLVA